MLANTENHNRPKTSPYHAQDEERKTRRNTTLVAATHLAGCTASSSQEAPLHFITRSLAEEKVVFAAQTCLTTWPAAPAIPHWRNTRLSRQPLARSTKKTTLYRLFYFTLSQTHLTHIPWMSKTKGKTRGHLQMQTRLTRASAHQKRTSRHYRRGLVSNAVRVECRKYLWDATWERRIEKEQHKRP